MARFIALLSVFCLCGCYSVGFEKPGRALEPAYQRQHFFVLGLIGDKEIDLTKECPRGATQFGEQFTAGDVLYGIFTLGIYTPKTVVVRCNA